MAEPKKESASLQSVYDGYAAKAKKSGKDTEVDIVKRHKVEFTEDFKAFKKGDKASVSTVMRDYYIANKVVKVGASTEEEETPTEDLT